MKATQPKSKCKADEAVVKKAIERSSDPKLPSTTTAKFSRFLREYITLQAAWNESVDSTLRRLLGLPPAEQTEKA